MFRVVRYCVQPFEERADGGIVKGDAQQFRTADEALRAAQLMKRRVVGAAVYEVAGWPVQDIWDRPRLLSRFGLVGTLQ
ncbi:hypothetical protein LRS10_13615 [Phenylobacterium sp. J426]|uniref:hypothetical protein n=1 Tax=Phenylobacterium sp. J426 TaxID=2898439 RepID=UPI0021517811|nr:hypothetical protein [Phenylobacterium sp. J426]MCR5875131.1 hypothetical protein [Phenylobacterium sp. J426]